MIEIDTHHWLLSPWLSSQYHTIYSQYLLFVPYSMRFQRIRHRHSCRRRSADFQPSWCPLRRPHPMSSSYQIWSIFSISIECSQEFSQALVAFRFTEKQGYHQYPSHMSGISFCNSYQNSKGISSKSLPRLFIGLNLFWTVCK